MISLLADISTHWSDPAAIPFNWYPTQHFGPLSQVYMTVSDCQVEHSCQLKNDTADQKLNLLMC